MTLLCCEYEKEDLFLFIRVLKLPLVRFHSSCGLGATSTRSKQRSNRFHNFMKHQLFHRPPLGRKNASFLWRKERSFPCRGHIFFGFVTGFLDQHHFFKWLDAHLSCSHLPLSVSLLLCLLVKRLALLSLSLYNFNAVWYWGIIYLFIYLLNVNFLPLQ